MALNKHPFQDRIAKKKTLFVLTGLCISLSLSLLALEYKSPESSGVQLDKVDLFDEDPFEIQQTARKEKVEKPKPKVEKKKIVASIIDPSKTTNDSIDFTDTTNFDFDSSLVFNFEQFGGGEVEVVDTVSFPDFMPIYPGGDEKLMLYLSQNIRYTERARSMGLEGWVVVEFVVGTDGKVNNPKIHRGLEPGLDKVCIRAVERMPDWKPGIVNGSAVAVKYKLPIKFKLN